MDRHTELLFLDEEGSIWFSRIAHSEGKPQIIPSKLEIPYSICSVAWRRGSAWLLTTDGSVLRLTLMQAQKLEQITNGTDLPFTQCSAGQSHTLFLDRNGEVWGLGANYDYQLASRVFDLKIITKLKTTRLPTISMVSAGNDHSLFLDTDACVWACGRNMYGQLGFEGNKRFTKPRKHTALPAIKYIEAGSKCSFFVTCDGAVWRCGRNSKAKLGLSTACRLPLTVLEHNWPPITAVSSSKHTLFLDSEGAAWGCGKNSENQLGLPTRKCVEHPVMIPLVRNLVSIKALASSSMLLDASGMVWMCGGILKSTKKVGSNSNRVSTLGSMADQPHPTPILCLPFIVPPDRPLTLTEVKSAYKI